MTERVMAAICLFDIDRRVLMHRKADNAPVSPGYWGFFGGLVDGEETPEQTVRRDMFNETGYRLHKPAFFIKEKDLQGGIHVAVHIFIEAYDHIQPVAPQGTQDWGWFTLEEALKLEVTPKRRKTLLKLQRYLKKQ